MTGMILLAEFHQPSEAKHKHVAVIEGPIDVTVRVDGTKTFCLVAVVVGVEWTMPHEHGRETLPTILNLDAFFISQRIYRYIIRLL